MQSDEVVEERHGEKAGGRGVEQAGQPGGHVLVGAAAVGLDVQHGEDRDMEVGRVSSLRSARRTYDGSPARPGQAHPRRGPRIGLFAYPGAAASVRSSS
ncbi:MAG TPA: hypothetical protein VFI46_00050 [Jiangellaceae bacterium]|nr:hypothetical protein [Jiangellaceae bacterium]